MDSSHYTSQTYSVPEGGWKVPKWTDADRPSDYLMNFERAMLANDEPRNSRANLLFTGTAHELVKTTYHAECFG